MSRRPTAVAVLAVGLLAVGGLAVGGLPAGGAGAGAAAAPRAGASSASAVLVRVPLAGAVTGEPLRGYLMWPGTPAGVRVELVDEDGRVVGAPGAIQQRRPWSPAFPAVQAVDLGRVSRPGSYRVRVSAAAGAPVYSPSFPVGGPQQVGAALAADGVSFLALQRDGAGVVPGLLDRKPSHLLDRHATVYGTPTFTDPDSDELAARPQPVPGAATVDVSGGWFDAGDYLKFTETASYTVDAVLVARRRSAVEVPGIEAEARHGLAWLRSMWDGRTRTLYAQVGIGSGSEALNLLGDHDLWRLPEADDAARVVPGDPGYLVSHRPVFWAAAPGQPLSPNLAGRVAAAFALAAQAEARQTPRLARADLDRAAAVLAQARTRDVGALVSTFPSSYYPETSWTDDLELGATEAARAADLLRDRRGPAWRRQALRWADATVAAPSRDTLNLYDTADLAHLELADLLPRDGAAGAQRRRLLAAVRGRLAAAQAAAALDPFDSAAVTTQFDAVGHEEGLVATARLYARVSGDHRFDAFATRQRAWVLGANAWGTSFVVGEGATFPQCPQHQVANLAGSLAGGRRVAVGGVVNGPNGSDVFTDLGAPDGARVCPPGGGDAFARFGTATSRYLDDVVAWPSVEPADDFTATSILATVPLWTDPDQGEAS